MACLQLLLNSRGKRVSVATLTNSSLNEPKAKAFRPLTVVDKNAEIYLDTKLSQVKHILAGDYY